MRVSAATNGRVLSLLVGVGIALGLLSEIGVLQASGPCGDGSACTPYTTGVPGVNLVFGCAPQSCASTCAPTGGPPSSPPPNGTSGVMKCKCGTQELTIPCSRKVKWTYTNGSYTRTVLSCDDDPCNFGVCQERPACEFVPGEWCRCTGP